ncbi:MAG: hypothetical protein LBO00_01425 [Zoogloeaceae bacterium]|jgi:hypothetical protein|nr:hypothetical protein [Zoogloeaceae bacterium]
MQRKTAFSREHPDSARRVGKRPRETLQNILKKKLRPPLLAAMAWVLRRPALRRLALACLARLPFLEARLRVLHANRHFVPQEEIVPDEAHMTPGARRAYGDLKAAIRQGKAFS